MRRSFRAFATKEDLHSLFTEFQNVLSIYYCPTYSDTGIINIDDITEIETLGVNRYGNHMGNNQFFVFGSDRKCTWRHYQCQGEKGTITRCSSICDENIDSIAIDLGGIYEDSNLFPTTISTMHYDNECAKELYDCLMKIFRKCSVKRVRGYFICPNAYEKKAKYRFCTIDTKSSREYDLIIE
jgi:hypothetical protein